MASTSKATSTSPCLSLFAPVRKVWSRLMPAADYPVDDGVLDGFLAGCVGCCLGAARDFCRAFSRNEARRDEEVRGLASELAQPVSMDQSVAALFLARAFAHLSGRAGSVDAPLAVGAFMVKKRPLYGTWVEEDPFPKRWSSAAGLAVAPPPTPEVAIVGTHEARVLRSVEAAVTAGGGNPAGWDAEAVEYITAKGRHAELEGKTRAKVLAVIKLVGEESLAYLEVFGANPGISSETSSVCTLLDLMCGKMDPKVVTRYCKECVAYLAWVRGLNLSLGSVGPVLLCSDLRIAHKNGKSVPTVVRARWFGWKAMRGSR